MNQKQRPRRKNRGATVAAVLCFAAAIALVGTYTFKDYRNTQKEQLLAQTEEIENRKNEEEAAKAKETTTDLIINRTETEKPEDVQEEKTETGAQEEAKSSTTEHSSATAAKSRSVNFNSSSKLLWPVNGNILMNYSMDKTVYFSTLDQYKYNPALIISGAEGDQVISATAGTVKSIDKTAQTGTTVNVDIGNGYELFYGQLKEVPVNVGDYVEAKTVLGYVSQPTKYYSVEGCNVYFEMRKDGQPVNPMEYLVED